MSKPKPYNPLVERLIQHTIRAEDEFWGALQRDLTPTGRTPQPFNPEPHNLPRPRKGHTLCLTTNPSGGGLRWTNTLMLGPESRVAGMFVVQHEYWGDLLTQPYCPVRFLPFYDIHARDREAKS